MSSHTFEVVGQYAELTAFEDFIFDLLRNTAKNPQDTIEIREVLGDLSTKRGDESEVITMRIRIRSIVNNQPSGLIVNVDRIDVPGEALTFDTTSGLISVLYYRGKHQSSGPRGS
jgi:hypothetical protein